MMKEAMMLSSWEQIQAALQRYPIREQGSDATTFDWPVQGPVESIFQVKFAEILGRSRVFIGVNVAQDGTAWAHEALVVNSEIAIGSLTAFKGNIVLKHVMTVGRFDEAELHEVIESMARTAEVAQGRFLLKAPGPHNTYVD